MKKYKLPYLYKIAEIITRDRKIESDVWVRKITTELGTSVYYVIGERGIPILNWGAEEIVKIGREESRIYTIYLSDLAIEEIKTVLNNEGEKVEIVRDYEVDDIGRITKYKKEIKKNELEKILYEQNN